MASASARLGRLAILTALCAAGCNRTEGAAPLFELLPPEATGITFANELVEDTTFSILHYLYFYNGAGVAAGDIDGDGLPDLYFTANLGRDRLYRNKGNFQFEEITERAGVGGPPGWTTGVTMADVNGDGHLDIYVSAVRYLSMEGSNVLYINNGDGTFTDRTAEFGLAHSGFSTQAAFFDYDLDGDLDMYLLNHSTHTERGVSRAPQRAVRHPAAGDRLFRNDDNRFVDVSEAAGIHGGVEGYGLGVVASDFDSDGCPDLFVANDFQENDFLYYNNCDGTFTESIGTAIRHTSRFSMGTDAADIDNDGRPDLVVLDMLPEREEILKSSANAENFTIYELKLRAGYHPQFARNTLQLNRGGRRFSEIGYLAGVHATDWSWAPLFADFDNDGDNDLFITNGIYRRPNDLDYINYVANDAIQLSLYRGIDRQDLELIQRMPQIPLPNYAFRNDGDLRFSNVADRWGMAQPGFSNGAAYVDLDNDGALDLVVSNINTPAAVYRNRVRTGGGAAHHLLVQLRGDSGNTTGIGARVIVRHGGRRQMREQMPTRGFQSSVDHRLHFGLGASATVDSLLVIWPDRRYQLLTGVAADRMLTLAQSDASGEWHGERPAQRPIFEDVTSAVAAIAHVENPFYDYNREPLMPHLLSREGPALASGDVNGDGLDDLYLGGSKWSAGQLLLQEPGGSFRPASRMTFRADSLHEDVDAAFFDADGDRDLDLYVVSSGNEFWGAHDALRDRLYVNDGAGSFRRTSGALPDIHGNGSSVAPGDYDGDGDIDLFVGGRVVARGYGLTPRSHLLENDGSGRFTDVTAVKGAVLAEAGMVTAAAWIDDDGDRRLELVVVGEWMPIRLFRQRNGRFVEVTEEAGFARTNGWWNSVTAADVNRDGRPDLILGNLGLNSFIRATPDEPARLYVHDFFQNGTLEQILTFYKNGVSYPLAGRDDLVKLMPSLRTKYPSYADFGASRVEDIFDPAELEQAQLREAYRFESTLALSTPDGGYELRPLPVEAQFSPVYTTLPGDFTGDGHLDLLLAGNFSGVTPVRGAYQASFGLLLRGDGTGRFTAVGLEESGLRLDGDVRQLAPVRSPRGRLIAVARNNAPLVFLRPEPRRPQLAGADSAP